MGSLKSFVKAVRKAKTIADERTVVRKEAAAIRTSFRDPNLDQATRRVNVSKLLYLYILGEKTHFGQVECLKLLALARFADKRLGYLATMLLLDENQEVLTLLTNSLDNDMQHPNTFIVGLALSCLGSVASPELARDLYGNVDRILGSSSPYLKKKACLVAAKLVDKEPDLGEVFAARVLALILDKTPLVLLGTCRLVQAIHSQCPDLREAMVKTVPRWIAHLRRVLASGYMPEYDVGGVTDPFLQVALLQTLRALVSDENCPAQLVEETNDVLAAVALGLDGGKNAAHAVLYECVKTIFLIRLDPALKVLGVNLLGKFLQAKDNNTRYVALELLLTVMDFEPQAVQRHRATIVSCLHDGDVSMRRRALELVFAILNEQNIRVLMREVLAFLEHCPDPDLRPYVASQLAIAVFRYAPNDKWQFDTLVRMLRVGGSSVAPDIVASILALVMRCTDAELRRHVVSRLLLATLTDPSQYALALVVVWLLGEYADAVVGTSVEVSGKEQAVTEETIVDVLDRFANSSSFSATETVQLVMYILTAAIKLSVKFNGAKTLELLRLLISSRTTDQNLEIQTRAVEYQQIFGVDEKLRRGLLARMPPPPEKEREALSLQNEPKPKVKPAAAASADDLLDLLDLNDTPLQNNQSNLTGQTTDLLSDIFGSTDKKVTPAKNDVVDDLLGLSLDSPLSRSNVGAGGSAAAAFGGSSGQAALGASEIEAFANGHLRITFAPASFSPGEAVLESRITSMAPQSRIEHVQLLIAVPKTQKLAMSTVAGTDSLTNGSEIRQVLRISGKSGTRIKLRVKVKYTVDGSANETQFDFAQIEHSL